MTIRAILHSVVPAIALALMTTSETTAQFQRTVLLEEITSVTCGPCAIAGRYLNEIMATYGSRVVSVRYHTNFIPIPKDPFHEANIAENQARRNYYNATTMPVIRVDGALNPPATQKAEVVARIDEELAIDAPVQISVTQTADGNTRNVAVSVTAGPEGLAAGHKLRIVAVEYYVHDETFANSPYNGEVHIYDIMRDFVPSVEGQEIELAPNETKLFTTNYTIGAGWQADMMYTVAFIQDDFGDQPVVQAGFSQRPVLGIETERESDGSSSLTAWPNPAGTTVNLAVTLPTPGTARVVLRDVTGRIVRTSEIRVSHGRGKEGVGAGRVAIDVSDLDAGVYTYTVESGAWRRSGQAVIVR